MIPLKLTFTITNAQAKLQRCERKKREKELKCYPYWVGYAVATCGGIGYILEEKNIWKSNSKHFTKIQKNNHKLVF